MTADATKYPEHAKLKACKASADVIADFLEWLEEQQIQLASYHEHTAQCRDEEGDFTCGIGDEHLYARGQGIEATLAAYFGIDLKKIDQEKDAMLEECRRANGAT